MGAVCHDYDIAYSRNKDFKHVTDKIIAEEARKRITAKDLTFGERERVVATAVWAAMKVKTKIGMGLKTKKKKKPTKKRILAKRDGIIPILLLGVVGSRWSAVWRSKIYKRQ